MKQKYIVMIILVLLGLVGYKVFFYTPKKYQNVDFRISDYHSGKDQDDDGIDDQSDILINSKIYIEKNPKYKSKYYRGGYSDDEYGVCTDVVAYALLHAGYDLRELVNADIISHQDAYGIDIVDKDIDFRRVQNLEKFFRKHAMSLTLDAHDIAQWQGGDIVVFENHIGIVSDHRNRKGINYVIHHNGPLQLHYEQDILAKRKDIIGHYRMQ